MDEEPTPSAPAAALRQRAEALFGEHSLETSEWLSAENARHLLREVKIQQIQLELQNTEIRRLQLEMDALRPLQLGSHETAPAVYVTGSDLQHVVDELRVSEAFERDILNSLPAHIAVLDPSGTILEVNEPWLRFARANGAPPVERAGVGANYLQACHKAWQEGDVYARAAVDGLKSVLEGGQMRFSLDYPCDGPDCGRWFNMEVIKPLGDKVGAIVAHTDISERKQAEEALRDASQKLRLHFEQTPMAVIEWDLNFRVTQWNPAARTIFGYTRQEALGRHASFIIPQAFHYLVDEVWQALLRKSGGERSTNPNVSKDGTPILCEWYNTPLIDERGTVRGVASVVMDITESTQAQQLLAWEKSALESISSPAPLVTVLKGLMLGLEKQLPGALCSVLLLDADGIHLRTGAAPSLPEAYNQAVDGLRIGPEAGSCGTAAHFDRQVIAEDIATDPLWAEFRDVALRYDLRACWSTPIHCGEGKILATFAIYYHQSQHPIPQELELIERAAHILRIAIERKRAEEEILQLNASLEQRVQKRTAQLQAANASIRADITERKLAEGKINKLNADLQVRAIELEMANQELESFSYSVSHDLRAPLRAVDGFSRMVISDYAPKLDDEGRRMLGVIRSEAQRMGRLIDDLLAFSRLGRTPIQAAPIDMHSLAQQVCDELTAAEPDCPVLLDLQPLPPASGTEALIRQVWVNLIGNALKFTKKRQQAVIQIGAKEDGQNGWIYYIKDNGAGFDMRYADKLFGVFQRLHNQQEFAGTGVGLALVQRIVKRHGGRIWATGEVDRGAAFYFTLPNKNS